ncbi:hypothetical protein J6590_061045 [Homalodisca vitripennis]|nr:hypothetical protein J6590_061045 [Homalodisca vitripennis]
MVCDRIKRPETKKENAKNLLLFGLDHDCYTSSFNQRTIIMERALGRRNRAEILGCVPKLQALEMGKYSLRPLWQAL